MVIKAVLGILAVTLLAACGGLEIRQKAGGSFAFEGHVTVPAALQAALADKPSCCAALSALPYVDLNHSGIRKFVISPDSPAFLFPSGKSYFAAYRITDLPRPFKVEVASWRSAEPRSLGGLMPDFRYLIFAPTILILDRDFQIKRQIAPGSAMEQCALNAGAKVYVPQFDVVEPASEAAYLVVMTTDDWLARDGNFVCGTFRHGFSPIGDLALSVTTVDFTDLPILQQVPAKWFAGVRQGGKEGLFAGIFDAPGLLMLGAEGLHYLVYKADRYEERLAVPYRRLVAAKASGDYARNRYLSIGVLEEDHRVAYHSFELGNPANAAFVPASELVSLLEARLVPARQLERIAWWVDNRPPGIEFLAQDGGKIARIGEAAMTGGMVTAFPCGICQAGVCPPEVILPCAALFSVGAVIGGMAGTGQELIKHWQAPAKAGSERSANVAELRPLLAGMGDKSTLADCLRSELAARQSESWRNQGREVQLGMPASAESGEAVGERQRLHAAGYHYAAELAIDRLALVEEEKVAAMVHLQVEGKLRFIDLPGREVKVSRLLWQGEARPIKDWIGGGASLVGDTLRQSCRAMAAQAAEQTHKAWQEY